MNFKSNTVHFTDLASWTLTLKFSLIFSLLLLYFSLIFPFSLFLLVLGPLLFLLDPTLTLFTNYSFSDFIPFYFSSNLLLVSASLQWPIVEYNYEHFLPANPLHIHIGRPNDTKCLKIWIFGLIKFLVVSWQFQSIKQIWQNFAFLEHNLYFS